MKIKIKREHPMIEFARTLVGLGYIYGATGWVCSKERRVQQALLYPEYHYNIMVVGEKWDGMVCYDCAQLTKASAKVAGVSFPSGARNQWTSDLWAQTGAVTGMPELPGLFLYRVVTDASGKTSVPHTGLYVGGGKVIEARGTEEGVILSDFAKYGWTHWGQARGIDLYQAYEEEIDVIGSATVQTKSGKGIGMWSESNNTSTKWLTIPENTLVYVLREVGNGWFRVMYGGREGYADGQYLIQNNGDSEPDKPSSDDYVTLTVNRSVAQALYNALGEGLGA